MYLLFPRELGIIRQVSFYYLVLSTFSSKLKRSDTLLTESEVSRSWTRLFTSGDHTEETFESAESLLDALRPESPLRLRLSQELEELQKIYDVRVGA